MPASRDAILPLLTFLSGSGAGLVAYLLLAWLQQKFPAPYVYQGEFPFWPSILHSPRYMRWIGLVGSALIALPCRALLAWLTGEDVLSAVDLTLAAFLSSWVSQAIHSRELPTEVRD